MSKIVLLAPPGAGKGTQGYMLAKHDNIPIIAASGLLKVAAKDGGELGIQIKQIMKKGDLVPDDIIIALVKERLKESDCKKGYLLDGFPRTIAQAEALYKAGIKLDYVIEISIPDDDIVERLSGRRIHQESGRVYHLKHNPPKCAGIDDLTREPLVQREDDKESTIRERLRVYYEKTAPLVEYYRLAEKNRLPAPRYIKIDGTGDIKQVQKRILEQIRK